MSVVLRGVSYTYPTGDRPAVREVDLSVAAGEVVLITGPTGCGKSTLLRLVAGLLQRHGQGVVQGSVRVGGRDPALAGPHERVGLLGFVSQEPGDQLVSGAVGDEVAFAMESAGMAPEEMAPRIEALLRQVGLDVPQDRSTMTLSGGQTQRLVVAAAVAGGAPVLLLDEPLSQLDPLGARRLLERLRDLGERGWAVLVVEHRIEACHPHVDRVVVMEAGAVVADAPSSAVRAGGPLLAPLRRLGLTVPGMVDLEDRLAPRDPSTVAFSAPESVRGVEVAEELLAVRDVSYRYEGASEHALSQVSLTVGAGERVAVLGGNGSGKSTLLRVMAGQLGEGAVATVRVVAVPQDPDLSLFCSSVRAEIAYGPSEERLDAAAVAQRVGEVSEALSVTEHLERAPHALSRGQRTRVAVAAALACSARVLLLDEPTAGQDHDHMRGLMEAVGAAMPDGAVVFATHDVDLALRYATRVLVLRRGRIVVDAPPEEVLTVLPEDVPLVVPPLWAWCRRRGIAPGPVSELVARVEV